MTKYVFQRAQMIDETQQSVKRRCSTQRKVRGLFDLLRRRIVKDKMIITDEMKSVNSYWR